MEQTAVEITLEYKAVLVHADKDKIRVWGSYHRKFEAFSLTSTKTKTLGHSALKYWFPKIKHQAFLL